MTTTVSEEDITETVDVEEALKLDGNDSQGKNGTSSLKPSKNDTKSKDSKEESSENLIDRGRLILSVERNHLLYAGEEWQDTSITNYNARIDYSLKLVCAHNFTGPSCSFAKICLNKNMKNNRRMYCTPEGEVVCREGWRGEVCEEPVCAPGCHATQGYC